MKWQDTTASKCRWSEYPQEIFHNWDIIWDNSNNDYQGSVEFVATKNGQFAYVVYSYGSCSGCDGWEELSENEVRRAFTTSCIEYFEDILDFRSWVFSTKNNDLTEFVHKHKELFDKQFVEDFENFH